MSERVRTGAWRRKGLGWKPYWDPRDGNHLMVSHLRKDLAGVALPEEKLWRIGPILDQGESGACFPAGTLVRMADGSHKPIENARLLDEVVTAEGRTGRILQTMVREHDGGLIALKIWGHNYLKMTPRHPVLTRRGYVAAKDIERGDEVAMPRFAPKAKQVLRLADHLSKADYGRRINEGLLMQGGVLTRVSAPPEAIPLSTEFGRLVGLYLAEGSTTDHKVVWTFNREKERGLVAQTVGLIREVLGAEARLQQRPQNATNVVLYGKTWRVLFERLLGTGAENKHLSPAVASGSRAFLRAVFRGWLEGDGYKRRNSVQGVTVSHRLALDMHAIATMLGLKPVIRRSEPISNKYAKARRVRYDLECATGQLARAAQQDEQHVWRRVRDTLFVPWSGFVYNLHVEGDESYVAEGVGVHNCVGFAWRAWMNAAPVASNPQKHLQAREIYLRAQLVDEFAGKEPAMSGTSMRAGAKVMRKEGYIEEYVWSGSADEILAWVRARGPLVFSTQWFDSMFDPDQNGYVRARGNIAGGHSLCAFGVAANDDLHIQQSWGEDYGLDGCIKMSRTTLSYLISQGYVSACAAAQVRSS